MSTEGVWGWGEEKKNRDINQDEGVRGANEKRHGNLKESERQQKTEDYKGFQFGVLTVGVKDTAEMDSERGVRPDSRSPCIAAVCEGEKTLSIGITDFSHGHSADFGKF